MPIGPDTTRHGEARPDRYFAAGTEGQRIPGGGHTPRRYGTNPNPDNDPSGPQPDVRNPTVAGSGGRPARDRDNPGGTSHFDRPTSAQKEGTWEHGSGQGGFQALREDDRNPTPKTMVPPTTTGAGKTITQHPGEQQPQESSEEHRRRTNLDIGPPDMGESGASHRRRRETSDIGRTPEEYHTDLRLDDEAGYNRAERRRDPDNPRGKPTGDSKEENRRASGVRGKLPGKLGLDRGAKKLAKERKAGTLA